MDKGTKIYAAVLGLLVVFLAFVFIYESPKVSDLNERLEADELIAGFPYQFRVLQVKNGVATMSTPRSTEVPVERVLGLLFSNVSRKATNSPEFQQAQQKLAEVQTRARDLVLSDEEIKHVAWMLDREWLSSHGVMLNP